MPERAGEMRMRMRMVVMAAARVRMRTVRVLVAAMTRGALAFAPNNSSC